MFSNSAHDVKSAVRSDGLSRGRPFFALIRRKGEWGIHTNLFLNTYYGIIGKESFTPRWLHVNDISKIRLYPIFILRHIKSACNYLRVVFQSIRE